MAIRGGKIGEVDRGCGFAHTALYAVTGDDGHSFSPVLARGEMDL